MVMIQNVLKRILANFSNEAVSTGVILSVLLMVTVFAFYEFIVYHLVSRRSFPNKSFIVSTAAISFFIATIILCLQSSLVLVLGTIGALAIIRYRNAIRDPMDMVYVLWAVHIGIICGCQLYEVGVLTSVLVTVVLLILERLDFGQKPCVLVLHTRQNIEDEMMIMLKTCTKSYRIKSRTYNNGLLNYAVELKIKNFQNLTDQLEKLDGVEKFSVVQYDGEMVL